MWHPRSPYFFSSRRRHTRCLSDWSSDVCSSDLLHARDGAARELEQALVQMLDGQAWVFSRERFLDEGWIGPRSEERRVGKECRSLWLAGDRTYTAESASQLMDRMGACDATGHRI